MIKNGKWYVWVFGNKNHDNPILKRDGNPPEKIISMGYPSPKPYTFWQMMKRDYLHNKKKRNWEKVKELEKRLLKLKKLDADIHSRIKEIENR